MIEQILSVGTLLVLGYTYVLYPRIIGLLSHFFGRPWTTAPTDEPSVSVILAAYNEESVIARCLDSILGQDYPPEKVEILIGSDCSSDRTPTILRQYAEHHAQIQPFLFSERRGKVPVVNDLVSHSRGEILFFTDSDVILQSSCLRLHARNYADEQVGGVAAALQLQGVDGTSDGSLQPEQSYLSVENQLRKNEAILFSTVGIFGGHYSVRRKYWKDVPDEPVLDELCVALMIVESGHRMVFEAEAIAEEYSARSMTDEFGRRTRFAARGLATLFRFKALMNPAKGWIAFMLWSHRLLRWLSPFILVLLFSSTVLGAHNNAASWFPVLLCTELAMIASLIAVAAVQVTRGIRHPLFMHLYWFGLMNIACLVGMYRFVFKRERKYWKHLRIIEGEKPRVFSTGIERS